MTSRTNMPNSMDDAILRANNEMESILSPGIQQRPALDNLRTLPGLQRLSSGIPLKTRIPWSERPSLSTGRISVVTDKTNMPDSVHQFSNIDINAILIDKKNDRVSSQAYIRLGESMVSFASEPSGTSEPASTVVSAKPDPFALLSPQLRKLM